MWWNEKGNRLTPDEIVKRDQAYTAGRKNYFAIGPSCLDQHQINRLRASVDKYGVPAKVVLYGEVLDARDQRSALSLSLARSEANEWLYEIITRVFLLANENARYDIAPSMNEPIQLLRYEATQQDFFIWHADTMPDDLTRKMSVVVPLSDPAEYEGGKLEFNQGGAIHEVIQIPGKPIVFPSWLIHQVTPVTAGRRYSLVAWIRGPNWR